MIAACVEKSTGYDEEIGALRAQVYAVSSDLQRVQNIEVQLMNLDDEPIEDLTRYERMLEEFEKELADAQASPWAEVHEIGMNVRNIELRGAEESIWGDRLLALAYANAPKTGDTEAALASAKETLQKRGNLAAEASMRNVERATKRADLLAEMGRLVALGNTSQASVKDRERKRDIEIEGLETKKKSALAAITDQRNKVADQRNHVQHLREKLSGLTARVLALSNPIELPEAPDMGELDRINTAIEASTQRRALASELKSIIDELEERDAEVEVYRALEYALQRCREEENATRGAGIVGTIANFLAAAGRPELPYMESGKNVCSVGWVRPDKRRVSIEAMSGGEYSLFCAALTAAVLTARGGELRMLMIEAAEADDVVIYQTMRGIEQMAAITHALVLTAHGAFNENEDTSWHSIELEQVAA
jgi:hypothetical protein